MKVTGSSLQSATVFFYQFRYLQKFTIIKIEFSSIFIKFERISHWNTESNQNVLKIPYESYV